MVEITKERLGFLKKLKNLQDIMDSFSWEKDGINRYQSYKYITEKQYKQNFAKALKEAGLLWKMECVGYEIVPDISEKMHLIVCKFRGTITDPESGSYEVYEFYGSGADNGDKALYKAVTGGHKFFLASNFNVAEGMEPEDDKDEAPKATPPASPEKREEIKKGLTDKDGQATKMQINSLKKALKALRDKDSSQETFIAAVAEKTANFTNIKKKACEELILRVSEMIENAS